MSVGETRGHGKRSLSELRGEGRGRGFPEWGVSQSRESEGHLTEWPINPYLGV